MNTKNEKRDTQMRVKERFTDRRKKKNTFDRGKKKRSTFNWSQRIKRRVTGQQEAV